MSSEPVIGQNLKNSSQFLTQIVPWILHRNLSPFGSHQVPISLKSIHKVLVEVVYLIFYLSMTGQSCYLTNKLWISQSKKEEADVFMLIVNEEEEQINQQEATKKKLLNNEESKQKKETEEMIEMERFIKNECHKLPLEGQQKVMETIQKMLQLCLQCYRESRVKGCILPTRFNQAVIKAEMDEFCYVYFSIIKPKLSLFPNPATLIRALEETRLFRQNALVLRYSNHSLLTKLASNQKCQQQIIALTDDFLNQRTLFLKDPKKRISICQEKIQEFFKMLAFGNIIIFSASFNDTPQENPNGRMGKIIGYQSLETRVYTISFNVEEVPYQFLTQQRLEILLQHPDTPLPVQQFSSNRRISELQLRYWGALNQLQLKLHTVYAVRFQELDLVSGVLGSVVGVLSQIDFSFEDAPRRKTNDRFVTLRTTLQLHPKECPFISMLEATDHLIACSLILDPELRTKREANELRKAQLSEMSEYLSNRSKELISLLQ